MKRSTKASLRAQRGTRRPVPRHRRQRSMVVASALIVTLFAGRLVQVQVFAAPGLAATALAGRMAETTIPAHRGQITDRNGVVLATSADHYIIAADQKAILGFRGKGHKDANGEQVPDGALGVAALLAPVLDMDRNELAAKLNGESRYLVLARDVDPEKQREIRKLGLQAYISSEVTAKRTYPAKSLAGTLVGFVDNQQQGQAGIERTYDAILKGTPGVEEYERGRDGVPIPGGVREVSAATTGGDVILTIDQEVQWKAEDALNRAQKASGAKYGIAVVQDIQSGEILALADTGWIDPNDHSNPDIVIGSRAIQETFEPGSTGKVVTMAAALETGVAVPESQFVVPYCFTAPNGEEFTDSHHHETQQLTLTGILATSSNSGTVQVAEQIPPDVQYEYIKKFHLGEHTGLGLPGESRGILHPTNKWDGRTRYTIAFGQGYSVNALQATSVFATVANKGQFQPATIVLGTREATSNEIVFSERPAATQAITPETAATLLQMLEQATSDDGTASKAQIPGYRVAGKTGTAEIRENGYVTFMASFIGVAPADNPRYVVSVFLKSPHSSIFGGVVAAPVFREIMGFTLAKYSVPQSVPMSETDQLPIYW